MGSVGSGPLRDRAADMLVRHIDTQRNVCWVLFTGVDDPPSGWYPCSAVTIR